LSCTWQLQTKCESQREQLNNVLLLIDSQLPMLHIHM